MSKALVLFHGNCADGFCAAWAAHRKLGDTADYQPAHYGQEPPDVRGRDLYLLDFSYKRPVMRQLLSQSTGVTVLDHHKTAEAELAGIVDEFILCPDLIDNPPGSELPRIHFDMTKSGGRLAWEHFHPNEPAPWLVDYTEDRDLWRWQLPNSREISAFLASYPHDFALWNEWQHFGPTSERFDSFVDAGAAILRYQAQQIEGAVKNAIEIELDGHKILAVNCTHLTSEIAGRLAEGRPFGAAYFIRGDGKKQWSLRSRDGGVDVSEIARRHGGGGHRNAAGFEEG